MARATTARRRQPARRVAAAESNVETRSDHILRRFRDEINDNPIKWMLIGMGVAYLYGRFRR
jgi:hypothetical protein